MQCALHSILTSRVILHLHKANAGENVHDRTLTSLRFTDTIIVPDDVSDSGVNLELDSFQSEV